MSYMTEIARMPRTEARQALIHEWHDRNEAGCCDDKGPFCEPSREWAMGYLCALAEIEWAGLSIPKPAERECGAQIGFAKRTCTLAAAHQGNHATGTGLEWLQVGKEMGGHDGRSTANTSRSPLQMGDGYGA
jgi:hypothetical protein